ncbi:MAG: hydrogenase expression/formation protein HypE [Vulcanococcus sp.]
MQPPDGRIQMGHGGGGRLMRELITELVVPKLGPQKNVLHDAARLFTPGPQLAFSTDSYVVRPLFFPGGDIGRLAVYGSVNDLAMAGARPLALSLSLIIEEGLEVDCLARVIDSVGEACQGIGVAVITGDTKVVERGKGDGLFINSTAIGVVEHPLNISPSAIRPGDAVIVSGDLGRHGLAVLSARAELGLRSPIESDLACLLEPVMELLAAGVELHCLRDLTRGGLASACDEIARSGQCTLQLEQQRIPVHPSVNAACEVLGLDPLAMANEGRMLVICPAEQEELALKVLQRYQAEAARVGEVGERWADGSSLDARYPVSLISELGVNCPMVLAEGEQIPRIC